jgi:signal transduction histidine kinase
VFLSIILNAVQIKPSGLRLSIATMYQEESQTSVIRFADNGPGMPPEIMARIFEPFFSTKDVGAGTGMGLATAFDIVTSYAGSIEVESTPGKGSEFIIKLPVTRP